MYEGGKKGGGEEKRRRKKLKRKKKPKKRDSKRVDTLYLVQYRLYTLWSMERPETTATGQDSKGMGTS